MPRPNAVVTRARLIPCARASPLGGPDPAAEGVERLDHADDRPEQAEQGGERRRAVEDADVALQVGDLAGGVVADRLADRRRRLAPVADDHARRPRATGLSFARQSSIARSRSSLPLESRSRNRSTKSRGMTRSRRRATSRSRA